MPDKTEIQIHLPEEQPGHVNTNGIPDDNTDQRHLLEATGDGIAHKKVPISRFFFNLIVL